MLKEEFGKDSSGHDWFHLERVWKNAKYIAELEGGDREVIELSALLHDIADHKFVREAEQETERRIHQILGELGVEKAVVTKVIHAVETCSFKGGHNEHQSLTLEGKIVQDADRLDAIGAVGIARTFAFGGKFGNLLYDPEVPPASFSSAEDYRKNRTHTINHFYEKLLLLKDRMNTDTGKKLAEQRHAYMQDFLDQFYREWEGKA